jgi:hypothetical protein
MATKEALSLYFRVESWLLLGRTAIKNVSEKPLPRFDINPPEYKIPYDLN